MGARATTQELISDLRGLIGAEAVAADEKTLREKYRDSWVLSLWRHLHGEKPTLPACVAMPKATREVAKVLHYAQSRGVTVVTRGAGSGVCGGVLASEGSIVVDVSRMNRLLAVDPLSLTASVEAGMLGKDYEDALRRQGFSMGHFPQSIDCSSVGGWVATRAAGQFSTKYGSIEDMLIALEAVLPDGRVVSTKSTPRSSTGPDLRQLFLGSEGTLGIITRVTYRIHPAAETTQHRSYSFPSMAEGMEAIRLIMRAGWQPAVLRLYDDIETARHFQGHADEGQSLLLLLCEGAKEMVAAEGDAIDAICSQREGRSRGRAPTKKWLEERNSVPSFESFLKQGMIVDTIEVAALWGKIEQLYEAVLKSMRDVPGLLVASGHSSHSYRQGTNIYFSFAASANGSQSLAEVYQDCWEAAMKATLEYGGTISHHHGIGRVRAPWMRRELGSSYHLLELLKQAIDPSSIMNPGVLLPRGG